MTHASQTATPADLHGLPERADLSALDAATLEPLEQLFDRAWPEVWRELATSVYVSLLSVMDDDADRAEVARVACAVTLGLAQDLGGRQPYIPVGVAVVASAKMRRVIDLLTTQRMGYRQVAAAAGLTEGRVRQIETAWRREELARRQGTLDLV